MIPDAHTPCPACPVQVRNLYDAGQLALGRERDVWDLLPTEYEELYQALEALRPFIEAHHANQDHAFSPELERAREPQLQETPA